MTKVIAGQSLKDVYIAYPHKEVSGDLKCDTVYDENGVETCVLHVIDGSLIEGSEEGTVLTSGRYTFHTHPPSAYKTYNTKMAWPSAIDYASILIGCKYLGTEVHYVVTLEGIYEVRACQDVLDKISPIDVFESDILDYIEDTHDISFDSGHTSCTYARHINTIRYKGSCLFKILFHDNAM